MQRICFYYFDWLAEKLRHTSVLLRVLKLRLLHFFYTFLEILVPDFHTYVCMYIKECYLQ